MDQRQEINAFINKELGEWAVYVLQRLAEQIKKKNLILSGDLLKSLQYELLKASAENVAHLKLAFESSGRHKDMKTVYDDKMPPIDAMEDFIRKVGLQNFKYLPYRKGKKVPTESIIINRLAWGIAKSRLAQNTTKPKKWFSRPFYGSINVLIENLTTKYGEIAARSITQPLNNQ